MIPLPEISQRNLVPSDSGPTTHVAFLDDRLCGSETLVTVVFGDGLWEGGGFRGVGLGVKIEYLYLVQQTAVDAKCIDSASLNLI